MTRAARVGRPAQGGRGLGRGGTLDRRRLQRSRGGRRTGGLLALTLAAVLAVVGIPAHVERAAAAEDPTAAIRASPGDAARTWTYDLYERGDFVSQATKKRCVSGAMQTMVNVMSRGADRSRRLQDHLHALAVQLAGPMEHVIGPYGWARALQTSGYGRYAVRAYKSRTAALAAAALAVRRTGRPAGLMVWRGAHSWVLHGFRATGDPLLTPDARITSYVISDPWYPRISSIWGPSKPPDSSYTARDLVENYLPWKRPDGRYPGWDGRFLVVEPVAPATHWWRVD